MAIENTVSSDFDLSSSSIVESVFDCRLSGVVTIIIIRIVREAIFRKWFAYFLSKEQILAGTQP